MVNKRTKGKTRERQARKILDELGYLTEVKNYSRFQSEDFWGLFDILAIHPKTSEVKLVQVKTNPSHFYLARKEIREWLETNLVSEKIVCEVWLKENRKEWRKETILKSTSK